MKSTFRTLFYLRANRVKNDGKAAIMIRITINGDITQFYTKLDVHPDLWDAKLGRVRGKSAEASYGIQILSKKANSGFVFQHS